MKKQFIYSVFILCVFGKLYAQTFTPKETYTYSRTYLEPVTFNPANPDSNNGAKQVQSVQYTDGLGRPKQDIAIKATYGGNDMVSTYFYDPITGRQTKQYLPVTKASGSGALQTVSEADINSYYGVANAFAEVKTEDSPLSRPLETAAPGDAWKMSTGKTKKTEYFFIGQDEIKKYKAVSDNDESVFQPTVTQTDNYAKSSLHKIVSTDEDGNVSVVYKNSMGQTLVTRQENGTEKLDTHYLYNQYGQLVMIIPPKASALGTLDQTAKDLLCYIYRYDAKGRLIEKKLPGKGKEEMVYDKADRLILYRDAVMNIQDRWLITKYDKFGRVLYTGFMNGGTRSQQQNTIANMVITETPHSTGFVRNGLQVYYSNGYFDYLNTVLSVNYYDEYPAGAPAKPALITETVLSSDNLAGQSTKTLPTASYVKNISDDKWTKTYYWYDQRGRSIGAQEINHLGGITVTHTELDWAGITKKVETSHQRTTLNTPILVKERFVYNDRNYLQEHYHQVNSNPEELLAKYTYNELGQVINKQVGNNLQSIDYSYNIRGWLTKVNDPAGLNGKLFAYELKYNNPANPSLATARYNGNITEVDWNSAADNARRRYGYMYDGNNRLTKGNYQEPGNTVPSLKYYDEEVSYDLNGNIATLKRNGKPMKGTIPSVVDNLTYLYNGNKLTSITDASANKSGYPGGGLTNTYDPNGNMLTMPDKKITQEMIYNFLNLPESIEQNTTQTQYYYRADGVKLKKVLTLSSQTIKTEYLDGFVYTTPYSGALKTAVEADTEIAKDAASAGQMEAFTLAEQQLSSEPVDQTVIQPYFFPTAEGFYDYGNKRYIYQYKDHLGNVRISYAKNTATGAAEYLNGNNYYPFGLNFINSGDGGIYNPSTNYANYKYNGKELQETGAYDYGWRQYMPDLGRWFGMDQLSEKFHNASPYAYVLNNPVMLIDPDGRDVNPTKDGWEFTGNDISDVYGYLNGGGNARMLTNALSAWGDMRTGQDFWSYFGSWKASGNYNGGGNIYVTTVSDGAISGSVGDIQGVNFTKTKIASAFSDNEVMQYTQASWRTGGGVMMMDSVFDVLGIALANAQPKNKNLAILLGGLAIGVSRGRAAPSVLRADAYAGVKAASQYLQAAGVSRLDRVDILKSFQIESISMRAADDATFGLRFYGGKAASEGRYLFPAFDNLTNRVGLALPEKWNSMTGIKQFQIAPGTPYIFGRAASQGGIYTGGSYQMFITSTNFLIK